MQEQKEKINIPDSKMVTLTKMNHIIEIQSMDKKNYKGVIKKINGTEYIHLDTGEIKEFENKSEDRSQNINSMYKTLKRLRYLINNNFTGAGNELFLTLTYAENMKDTERLYKDLDKFYKRLRYRYKGKTSIDYLNVIEPQKRGAWHCHILLRFNDLDKIYIPNNELEKIWGNGFTKTKSIENVDNIGAYLTAYLTDMEFSEVTPEYMLLNNLNGLEIKTIEDKRYVKGARLCMYPSGLNIYRHSRGIKPPERIEMSYRKAKKYIGAATPTYLGKSIVKTDTFENTILYEYYNTKRG